MKKKSCIALLFLLVLPAWSRGQAPGEDYHVPSGGRAFALSLLLPGLGHRYANGGDWNAAGTVFALADGVAWVSLLGARWQHAHFLQSYENLAQVHAGAEIDGQSRAFLLNLGQYDTSAEYIEFLLRARAWDRLETAESPEQQWSWGTEANRLRYKELRSDADKMERRTTWVAAILVGNRLISALSALRAANKAQPPASTSVDILPGDVYGGLRARLRYTW